MFENPRPSRLQVTKSPPAAVAKPQLPHVRRVVAGLRYCPEVEEYVREDDGQCLYFKPKNGVTLDPVMQSRAHEESYPNQGGLST